MKVFISWSGDRSRQVALALREWLPMVIQAVQPFMSDQDNDAGVRWLDTVTGELEEANFGIVCVTPDNVNSRWLNFEAGAISKAVDKARVVPLLHGFSSLAEVPPPLGQFQAKMADEKGIMNTLAAINKIIDDSMPESRLENIFRVSWPELKLRLEAVPKNGKVDLTKPQRPDRELLEELLQLSRKEATVQRVIFDSEGKTLTGLLESSEHEQRRWLLKGLHNLFGENSVHPLRHGKILITNLPEVPSHIYHLAKAFGQEIVPNTPPPEAS
jgi:hypothetical protein